MLFNIKIKTDTLSQNIQTALQGLRGGGKVELNRALGEEFMAITFSAFGAGGKNRPHDWPALSPKYQKAIGYFGPPTLILDGYLSTSINILDLNSQYVEVGTDIEYAAAQQFGNPSSFLPARPYFPVVGSGPDSVELTDYARQRMENRLLAELARYGFQG